MTHFARQQEALFIQFINRKNNAETRREIERLQRELELMRRRNTELSTLFKRLYEERAWQGEKYSRTAEQEIIIHYRDISVIGAFAEETEKITEEQQRQTA